MSGSEPDNGEKKHPADLRLLAPAAAGWLTAVLLLGTSASTALWIAAGVVVLTILTLLTLHLRARLQLPPSGLGGRVRLARAELSGPRVLIDSTPGPMTAPRAGAMAPGLDTTAARGDTTAPGLDTTEQVSRSPRRSSGRRFEAEPEPQRGSWRATWQRLAGRPRSGAADAVAVDAADAVVAGAAGAAGAAGVAGAAGAAGVAGVAGAAGATESGARESGATHSGATHSGATYSGATYSGATYSGATYSGATDSDAIDTANDTDAAGRARAPRRPEAALAGARLLDPGRMPSVVVTAIGIGVVVAGMALAAALQMERLQAGPVMSLAESGAAVKVRLKVAGDPTVRRSEGSRRPPYVVVRATVEEVVGRGAATKVRTPVVVIGSVQWKDVRFGQHVEATGRLQPVDKGGEVAAMLSSRVAPRVLDEPAWWLRAAERVRAGLRQSVADEPEAVGGLVPALVMGDVSGLPPELVEDFETTGLTHLSAVSGSRNGGCVWAASDRLGTASSQVRIWFRYPPPWTTLVLESESKTGFIVSTVGGDGFLEVSLAVALQGPWVFDGLLLPVYALGEMLGGSAESDGIGRDSTSAVILTHIDPGKLGSSTARTLGTRSGSCVARTVRCTYSSGSLSRFSRACSPAERSAVA
jgi:hypothetical protein